MTVHVFLMSRTGKSLLDLNSWAIKLIEELVDVVLMNRRGDDFQGLVR